MHSQTNIMKTHNFAKLCLNTRVTFLWTDKQLTQSCLPKTKSIFNSGTALLYYDIHLRSTILNIQLWTILNSEHQYTPLTISQKLNWPTCSTSTVHLFLSIPVKKQLTLTKHGGSPKVSLCTALYYYIILCKTGISINTPFCNPWDSPLLYSTVLSSNLTGKLKLL